MSAVNAMTKFYVFKDGMMAASTADRKSAVDLIRIYQAKETHPFLRSEFSIIKGEEEFIPYSKPKRIKSTVA
jgi:hypothetical protein